MVIGLHSGQTKCWSFPKVHPPQQRHHGQHLGPQCHRLRGNGGHWNQRALQGTGATGQRWTNKHKHKEIHLVCLDKVLFKYRSTEEPEYSPEASHSELVYMHVTNTRLILLIKVCLCVQVSSVSCCREKTEFFISGLWRNVDSINVSSIWCSRVMPSR